MRHVIAPFLIELREFFKFRVELLRFTLLVLDFRIGVLHFEGGIPIQLLLDERAQFEHRHLQNLKALLELRCQNLLLAERLSLRESGHRCCLADIVTARAHLARPMPSVWKFSAPPGTLPANHHRMNKPNKLLLASLGVAAFASAALIPHQGIAQDANEQQQIVQIVAEISKQQAQIVANQKQIEEKMAAVTENLRLAKIFVSRGGGASK